MQTFPYFFNWYMIKNNGTSYSAGKYDISTLNTDLGVTIKGDKPSEGKICILSNGSISKASLKINGYIVSYDGKEAITADKEEVEDITCDVVGGPTQVLATNGETYVATVYLDPTDLTNTCNSSNSVSKTGTKNGCMKWYVYKDDGTNYTMILDHNTTATVAWNSEGKNTEMKEVKTELDNLASVTNWKVTPRLIEADEVASITGNTTFNQNTATEYFYLDSNSITQTVTSAGASKYAWLYDYTNDCASYGCNIADSNASGYWTSNFYVGNNTYAWIMSRRGQVSFIDVDNASLCGVRPVITISKDIIK